MNYIDMEKEDLKSTISAKADGKGFELPASWFNYGQEKMIALAEEIDAYVVPVEESQKPNLEKVVEKSSGSSMRDKILADEKVTVDVPEDEVSNTNHINIWLNGVEFIYKRGQVYEMPKCVAEVYRNAQRETSKAKKRMASFTEVK